MIGENPKDIGMYTVTCHPKSKLRSRIWDIFPYWQGAKPEFEVSFTARDNLNGDYNYLVKLLFQNNAASDLKWQIQVNGMKKGESQQFTIDKIILLHTGDAFVTAAEITDSNEPPIEKYEKVFMFHITNRSWIFLTILAGIIAGVISLIGNIF